MLGGAVHLRDGFAHLAYARALLAAGGADLGHDVGDAANGVDHFLHRVARLVGQLGAVAHALHAGVDQGLDFFGGLGAASGQGAHLAGHHGKTAALLTGAGCFDSGVQRQDVGLKSDAVDHADDRRDALAAVLNLAHGADHLLDHAAALVGHVVGIHGQLVGLGRVVGVLAHGRAQLLHRGGGLLQSAGLLLGAGRQVVVALGNFGAGIGHAVGVLAHAGDDAGQFGLHFVQAGEQGGGFIAAADGEALRQVAVGNFVGNAHGLVQGPGDGAPQCPGSPDAQQQGDAGDAGQHDLALAHLGQGGFARFGIDLELVVGKLPQGLVVGIGQGFELGFDPVCHVVAVGALLHQRRAQVAVGGAVAV